MNKFLIAFVAAGVLSTGYASPRSAPATTGANFERAPILPMPSLPVSPPPAAGGAATTPPQYSVSNCMDDVRRCVENELAFGLRGMFAADIRNSIIFGMRLCENEVEHCVRNAQRWNFLTNRYDRAYRARNDVWVDFNSRVVQPEYFNIVQIRSGGLTPLQAENTCLLLDRNLEGRSFAEVSREMQTQRRGPLGATVNPELARGQFARWDPIDGRCQIRVAAYRRRASGGYEHITRNFLFGAVESGDYAERWANMGDTISCNQNFFGMRLRQVTEDVALVGMVGGTALGAGIGAISGQGRTGYEVVTAGPASTITFTCADPDAQVPAIVQTVADVTSNGVLQISFTRAGSGSDNTIPCRDLANYAVTGIATTLNDPGNRNLLFTASQVDSSDPSRGLNIMAMAEGRAGTRFAVIEVNELTVSPENLTFRGGHGGTTPEGGTRGRNALIGAGIGLAAGGVATLISSFIEGNQIFCMVGNRHTDIRVNFNRTSTIPTLRQFFVDHNLNIPEVVFPREIVRDCDEWRARCQAVGPVDCELAVINFQPDGAARSVQVETACTLSGNTCIQNHPIAYSHGMCHY